MSDKKRLNVIGISYSRVHSRAFAMLLEEEGGSRRIPIVIGETEAQSIAISLEGIIPPRPLTHDLFGSFAFAFGVRLVEVFIYKFEDGIFSSEMVMTDGFREVKIDSRTSDAVAIALRMNAPIYTTEEILDRAGASYDSVDPEAQTSSEDSGSEAESTVELSTEVQLIDAEKLSIDELHELMEKLIDEENYEEAAKVNQIIKSRSKQ